MSFISILKQQNYLESFLFAFKNSKLNFICRESMVNRYKNAPCWLSPNGLCYARLMSPLWMENESSFFGYFLFSSCTIIVELNVWTKRALTDVVHHLFLCFKALCPVSSSSSRTFHLGTIWWEQEQTDLRRSLTAKYKLQLGSFIHIHSS